MVDFWARGTIWYPSLSLGKIPELFSDKIIWKITESYFFQNPINELSNESLSLDNLVNKSAISRIEDLLSESQTDRERINIVEQFLLSQLIEKQEDKMVTEAVRQIYEAKGKLKMKQLADFLSPL